MLTALGDVRFQGQPGRHLLTLSSSQFDPLRTSKNSAALCSRPASGSSCGASVTRSNCCQWWPGRFQMLKDKKKKGEVIEAPAASGKVSRKEFEKELAKLQVELTRLQTWVKGKGSRIIVVFEGRDTAGKGGVISRITARTSPRVYRHVALPVPSDRERTQVFIQRYIAHFPAAGEIVLFDRSWYNRAGVERVMDF